MNRKIIEFLKANAIISIAILIIGIIGLIGLRIISEEDNWICTDGKWVQHGKPSSPMPTGFCETEVIK